VSRAKTHEPPEPKVAKRKGGAAKKAGRNEHEEDASSGGEEPEAEPPTPKKTRHRNSPYGPYAGKKRPGKKTARKQTG
jgi:hypothetical protein